MRSARFLPTMSENEDQDWLAELAKGGEALRRQIEQLFQGAEQVVRVARQGKTSGIGPVPPFQQRLVRAFDAAMDESCQSASRSIAS